MNQLDPIENQFKAGLAAFPDIAPSKGLFKRIERSMLLISISSLFSSKKKFILLFLLLVGTVWTAFSLLQSGSKRDLTTRNISYNQYAHQYTPQTSEKKINQSSPIEEEEPMESVTQATALPKQSNVSKATISTTSSIKAQAKEFAIVKTERTTLPQVSTTKGSIQINSSLGNPSQKTNLKYAENKVISEETIPVYPISYLNFRPSTLIGNPQQSEIKTEVKNAFRTTPTQLYTKVMVGIGQANTNLSTPDLLWNDYIAYRNTHEKKVPTTHLGIYFEYHYKNWIVSTGIEQMSYTQKLQSEMDILQVDKSISTMRITRDYYIDSIVGYIQTPIDSIPVINHILDTTIIIESQKSYFDSTFTNQNVHYTNTLSYIKIPLMVGYEFHYKEWFLDVSLGLSYSRLLQQQILYPNTELNRMIDYSKDQHIIRKHQLNANMALGLGYQINPNMSLMLCPTYQYQLKSSFQKSYPVIQKYQHIGISAGMRFKL